MSAWGGADAVLAVAASGEELQGAWEGPPGAPGPGTAYPHRVGYFVDEETEASGGKGRSSRSPTLGSKW